MSRSLVAVLLAGALGWGCEEDAPPSAAPPPPEPARFTPPERTPAPPVTTRALVVTDLAFVDFASDGVADGFDLDGVEGNAGCGHLDFVSPDGRAGIDNQLAGLLPILRMTEAAALDGLVQESVNGGLTMFLVQLSGLDGGLLGDDDAVEVHVFQGAGPQPFLDTAGRIEPDQTFAVHPESPQNRSVAALVDGVLTTAPFEMALPAHILNARFTLRAPVARAEFVLNADGSADGIIGGAVEIESLVELANSVATSIGDLATTLLRTRADLLPDDAGRCTAMSAYFRVHMEPAYLADWSPPSAAQPDPP